MNIKTIKEYSEQLPSSPISLSKIEDVFIVEAEKHHDARGWFQEIYHLNKFLEYEINISFVQDNLVYSKQNVLRGLHFQKENGQSKLISCIKGNILDVFVDLRKESKTYKHSAVLDLSEDDNRFIYIPEGFAHGYCVKSNEALVHYKCTEHYDPENEIGIIWNDPDINIDWPQNDYILSDKDKLNKLIKELNL